MFRRSALIVFGVLWGHASIGNALPITYQFAGQLDQVSTITIVGDPDIPTVADGDPWSATITFDDSFLSDLPSAMKPF
jgi:hypothetical protein